MDIQIEDDTEKRIWQRNTTTFLMILSLLIQILLMKAGGELRFKLISF